MRGATALPGGRMWPPGELRQAMLCAAMLATYGNVLNAVSWSTTGIQRSIVNTFGPLALLAIVLYWHRHVDRRTLDSLGLHTRGWRTSTAWGTLAGVALAVPPLLARALPISPGAALQYYEVRGIGLDALLLRLLVTTPVLVAFVEEVAFRGFLQGKLQRAFPARPLAAIALSSLSFALWHVGVTLRTLQQTNVGSAGFMP